MAALNNETFGKDHFSFYPNPVQDRLYIDAAEDVKSVCVYDALGQKILEHSGGEGAMQLDFSAMRQDVYFVSARSEEGEKTFRILKQ